MQAKEIALFVCHLHFVCVANWKILRQSQAKQSNYVANWVGWSRGRRAVGWVRVEGWGIATSCASHTIRARPTPSALPHFPHQLASTPRPAWNIYVTRSKSLKSKSESQAQRAGQCQRGVGLKTPARWAGTWGWIIASRHWLRLVSLQISWPIANDNANSSNNTATRQWSNSNMTRRRHGKRLS